MNYLVYKILSPIFEYIKTQGYSNLGTGLIIIFVIFLIYYFIKQPKISLDFFGKFQIALKNYFTL